MSLNSDRVWMHVRVVVAATAAAALLAAGVAAIEGSATAAGGPEALVAKKKKKKATKRAKKFLQGAVWQNVVFSPTTGASTQTSLALCRDGRYLFQKDNDSIVAASRTTYEGTWNVVSANLKKALARIRYTVQNFSSVYFDGSPGPDSPPPSPGTLTAQAVSNNQVFFDGVEFSRGTGIC